MSTDQKYKVALSLGSNLGDRRANIYQMIQKLESILNPPYKVSVLMETAPVDVFSMQPLYYNRIFCGIFSGDPTDLLEKCFKIELCLGRVGKGLKEPRTADIDILLFGDLYIKNENLTVPHPQIFSRRYCLEGLNEIVPDWTIPGRGLTVRDLYATIELSIKEQGIKKLDETESGN